MGLVAAAAGDPRGDRPLDDEGARVDDAELAVDRHEVAVGVALLAGDPAWVADEALALALREPLLRLGARYLSEARRGDRPVDSVARFHLGNGARIERLNWLADRSDKGLRQSWGMMVNYLYDPDSLEANLENFAANGSIAASSAVRRLARR